MTKIAACQLTSIAFWVMQYRWSFAAFSTLFKSAGDVDLNDLVSLLKSSRLNNTLFQVLPPKALGHLLAGRFADCLRKLSKFQFGRSTSDCRSHGKGSKQFCRLDGAMRRGDEIEFQRRRQRRESEKFDDPNSTFTLDESDSGRAPLSCSLAL